MKKMRLLMWVAFAATGLALAGCSGDHDRDDQTQAAAPAASQSAQPANTAAAPAAQTEGSTAANADATKPAGKEAASEKSGEDHDADE